MTKVEVLFQGRWRRDQVFVTQGDGVWEVPLEFRAEVDRRWGEACNAKGKALFDGPLARVDQVMATQDRLELSLSRTSYKPFFAVHFSELRQRFIDPNDLPNALGVSVALESADEHLLFGRRGDRVAYYPNRIHPFAGSMEPGDSSPFETALRELKEEAFIEEVDITEIELVGIVQDPTLSQPEAVLRARTNRTSDEIRKLLDGHEHDALIAVPFGGNNNDAMEMMIQDASLTPVCLGTIMLWADATGR